MLALNIISNTNIKDYQEFFLKVKNGNHFSRLFKTFCTKNYKYILDTGTGKIFQINENVYLIFDYLFRTDSFDNLHELGIQEEDLIVALEEIKECVEKENILLAPPVKCFVGPNTLALEENLNNNMNQLTLELTERCNLRCDYCIYQESHDNYREFSNLDMTFETAKKALDYYVKHVGEKLIIAFYGGEPLLKYDLIKQCVEYIKKIEPNKELILSLTTNATLITKEMAEYFSNNEFVISVSLDGPEDIHDENRKFPDGTGSFKYTMRGYKILANAYKDKEAFLYLNCVTTGPNYTEKYDKIQNFFDSIDWMPKSSTITTSYASYSPKEEKYSGLNSQVENNLRTIPTKTVVPLHEWYFKQQNYSYNHKKLFASVDYNVSLAKVHNRCIVQTPMENYYFNGCCIPGARRLEVSAEGDFYACEKIGRSPVMGNVDEGININAIKKHYVNDFMKEAVKYCNDCWAIHMCSNCYIECFDENGVNLSYRHSLCRLSRYILEKNLILYHEILENDPESLRPLNDIKLI